MAKLVSMKSKKTYKPQKCKVCFEEVTCGTLSRHMMKHSNNRSYKCTICNSRFKHKFGLKSHLQIHGSEKSFCCSACDKSFYYERSLQAHFDTVHLGKKKENVYFAICVFCNKSLHTKESEKFHLMSHIDENPYSCVICNRQFTNPHTRDTHIRSHIKELLYKCNLCKRVYSDGRNLHIHQARVHGSAKYAHLIKKLVCEICGKELGGKRSLQRHVAIHSGEKPYSCQKCGKKFSRKDYLVQHGKIHVGGSRRTRSCPICNKEINWCGLNTHIRTHTAEKILECKICHKRFQQRGTLKSHELTHLKDRSRNFRCIHCSSAFMDNWSLKRHMKFSHGYAARFNCTYCEKTFAHKEGLKYHLSSTHQLHSSIFCCVFCQKIFYTQYQLHNHLRRHTMEFPFSCELCNVSYPVPESLRCHNRCRH